MVDRQVILITGTSSGFGRLMSETLAQQGHTVYASMRNVVGKNAGAAAELDSLAKSKGLSLRIVELDVTDDAMVDRAVGEVVRQEGRIDILVNNAGFGYIGLNETFTTEQVQRIFDTNFFAAVRLNRAVLPYMRQQGSGLLVYISSGAGRLVLPFGGLYCATKFALEALAESYHYQLSPLGIDTIIVEPSQYPSRAPDNFPPPADPARAVGYGESGENLQQAAAAFMQRYYLPDAPDPQEVADKVAELIALPADQRPLRQPVGPAAAFLNPMNQEIAQIQEASLSRFGLTKGMKFL